MTRGKIWIAAALVILVGGATYAFVASRKTTNDPSYRVAEVERGDIDLTILSAGTVEPKNRLEIKPPVAGRADRVLVVEGQSVRKGQIIAWMSSTERAALLDAARAKGPEEVARWEEYYKPTPVIAPIDGTVILRSIEPGQTFTNQDAVLVISDRLSVKAQVDETDLAQIRLKQDAVITLDAYSQDKIPAKVTQIAYEAKTVNNVTTYDVEVVPERTPQHMRSGMTANVTFNVGSRNDVWVVPAEAIQYRDDKAYILFEPSNDNDKPEQREVTTGLTDGKRVEIVAGISGGERIRIPQVRSGDAPQRSTNPFAPSRPRSSRKSPK